MLSGIGASFAENFYGVKRVRAPRVVKQSKANIDDDSVSAAAATVTSLPGSNRLRERDIRKSLLFLVRRGGGGEFRRPSVRVVLALITNATHQDEHFTLSHCDLDRVALYQMQTG